MTDDATQGTTTDACSPLLPADDSPSTTSAKTEAERHLAVKQAAEAAERAVAESIFSEGLGKR